MVKKSFRKRILLILALASLTVICGCIPLEKFERTMELSGPIDAAATLTAKTHNGALKVTGSQVTQCSVVAKITTKADTKENAIKLSELIDVRLENSADGIVVVIDKPKKLTGRYLSVEFDITLPANVSLGLKTHNGRVDIVNIEGDVKAHTHNGAVTAKDVDGDTFLTTHNGKIKCSNVKGDLKLETHNGEIHCDGVAGNFDVRTHNGKIGVSYVDNADGVIKGYMETHNGSVKLDAPEGLSVKLKASTHNGSVHTSLPITVVGKIKKNNLKGTIGAGEGSLILKTHNGSISIR